MNSNAPRAVCFAQCVLLLSPLAACGGRSPAAPGILATPSAPPKPAELQLFADHVHPNDRGYRIMADEFFRAISRPRGPDAFSFGFEPPSVL